jgi:ABC-2 type transport system permease protein
LAQPTGAGVRGGWRLPGLSPAVAAVAELELRTLVRSPKGRLLFAMPFFLVILLKLVGAAPLLAHLWGPRWTAFLLTALSVYVLASLAGQFFANQFGYDGHAVRRVYLHPSPLRAWLLGRNLAHAGFATAQMLLLAGLIYALLPETATARLALPLFTFPFGLLVLLGVGNLLSVRHPRRFHFDLSRRDRPAPTTFIALALTLGAGAALAAAAREAALRCGWPPAALLPALPALGWAVYRVFFARALRALRSEREGLIGAITGG